ncbi:helix-turn-helix transcriptional regulator [Streptomyces sp. MAA16]|uniref:helix-turn-helix domain-containing protein n=1 Tax=Streptomyces sp. MAA16 TaxID=3035116 RepID=UPI00247442B1|nr:helix-turn-helix transcriptional regulator [Streptomyces sp. MAA16]MDH6700828.1 transcriptional regulator with XRE-family HTH domain [Streptomyces sp. MAA16]
MPQSHEEHAGARIADYRKLRQMSQTALAQRAFLARSTVAKVEAGLCPASATVLAAIARALQVDVAVLLGQPYISELRQDHLDRLISPLSEALDMYDLGPDPDITPRPVARIADEVAALCAATCATEYKDIGTKLPGLVGELTTAVALLPPGEGRRRASESLAWSYWVAYEFAYRLGYHHLASIALERMGWMAEQAQDPLLLAVRLAKRSSMLLRRGDNRMSLRIIERGLSLVDQAEDRQSVNSLAVSGSLHLASAIAAAQAKNEDGVTGYLELAGRAAGQIGRDVPDAYWCSFGVTNVRHYEVATRVELGQLGDAVKEAQRLHFPAGHPKMRVGRYFMEMGRAYEQMGKAEAAYRALKRAREAAPQQARYHPLMRETIGALVRRQRRASDSLSSMAAWVGM